MVGFLSGRFKPKKNLIVSNEFADKESVVSCNSKLQWQNLLLSTTLNEKVNHIAKLSLENPVMIGLDDNKIQLVLSFEDFGSLGFDLNDEFEQPDKLTSSPIADFRVPSQLFQRYVKGLCWYKAWFCESLSGTMYLASTSHEKYPGKPQEFKIHSNSTFYIPVNDAHQINNPMFDVF